MFFDHALLHWLSGLGHAEFLFRVVGDGPGKKV